MTCGASAGTAGNAAVSSCGQASQAPGARWPAGASALLRRRHPRFPPPCPTACALSVRSQERDEEGLRRACPLRRGTSGTVSPRAFCTPHHSHRCRLAPAHRSACALPQTKHKIEANPVCANFAHPITVSQGAAVERMRCVKKRDLGIPSRSGGSFHDPGRLPTKLGVLECSSVVRLCGKL
jgi:hypothetical protein